MVYVLYRCRVSLKRPMSAIPANHCLSLRGQKLKNAVVDRSLPTVSRLVSQSDGEYCSSSDDVLRMVRDTRSFSMVIGPGRPNPQPSVGPPTPTVLGSPVYDAPSCWML